MYLSRLEIFGFKSFAKKTQFIFNNGITGVVGPNGCGKSNIVDAIRWVLGEQKAGVLRSERMENVIFNGSKTQKPLGMAEVSLTIENTRNVLPIEYSEVVITRRLFRSGESQYLLNNSICRLKDIMDLFMDTGMGPNAYSVIELAMVEQILNGKAEERRHIFEEAAGVGKYKARRKAAFRKLEATESDLQRLNDILTEVEKNVDSLKRQVQKAERYKNYADELKETELLLSTYQLVAMKNELEPLSAEAKELHNRREQISAHLATEEAEIEELRLKLLELEKQLVSRQRDLNANTEFIQKKEEDILVSQERIRGVQENRGRFTTEIAELERRSAMLTEMQATLTNKLEEMRLHLEGLEGEHADKHRTLEAQRESYQAKRLEMREVEAQRTAESEQISNLQKEQERLRTQIEVGEQRRDQLLQEQSALALQKQELEVLRDTLSQKLAAFLAHIDQIALQDEENQQVIVTTQGSIEELKQRALELTAEMQRHRDRAALLRKILETYEDHPEGVKHLLLEGGMQEGCLGTLGEKIRVQEPNRRAVEAALGDAVVALLVDRPERAFEGIETLASREKGLATFLSIHGNGEAHGFRLNGKAELSDNRIMGRISDLVDCDADYREVVEALLSNSFLVNTVQSGRELAQQESAQRLCFVTPSGELVTNWGLVRGGFHGKDESSLIGRRQQMEALEEQMSEIETETDRLTTQRERAEAELRRLQENGETLSKTRKSIEKDRQQLELEFGQAAYRLTKTDEEIASRTQELERLNTAHAELQSQLATVQPRLGEVEEKRLTAESAYTLLSAAIELMEQSVRAAEQEANEANVRVVEARAEIRNVESEHERTLKSLQEIAGSIQLRNEQIQEAESQEQSLVAHIAEVRQQLQDDFAERKELEDLVNELEKTFREQKAMTDGKERALKPLRHERDEVSDRLHHVELRISELTMQKENLCKHIHENYELDLNQHAAQHPPVPQAEFDVTATDERVGWLRNRLKSMGPVNMLALVDYDKEKERFDFLTSQKEDLIKAEENLKETIKVINDTAYERFGKVFSQIRENFIQVFKSFFEGGIADLRLDEGDPLEADIVIEASPKGKKLGSLALLSGGEKTLTAISLLFAIYLVKPSPFCILDEVDAPLDDSNIRRFTGAIRKFSENTQFITVTHNKGTMSAADYLYGVTMEEQGVSKVVSVKFEEVEVGKAPRRAEEAVAVLNAELA